MCVCVSQCVCVCVGVGVGVGVEHEAGDLSIQMLRPQKHNFKFGSFQWPHNE